MNKNNRKIVCSIRVPAKVNNVQKAIEMMGGKEEIIRVNIFYILNHLSFLSLL